MIRIIERGYDAQDGQRDRQWSKRHRYRKAGRSDERGRNCQADLRLSFSQNVRSKGHRFARQAIEPLERLEISRDIEPLCEAISWRPRSIRTSGRWESSPFIEASPVRIRPCTRARTAPTLSREGIRVRSPACYGRPANKSGSHGRWHMIPSARSTPFGIGSSAQSINC